VNGSDNSGKLRTIFFFIKEEGFTGSLSKKAKDGEFSNIFIALCPNTNWLQEEGAIYKVLDHLPTINPPSQPRIYRAVLGSSGKISLDNVEMQTLNSGATLFVDGVGADSIVASFKTSDKMNSTSPGYNNCFTYDQIFRQFRIGFELAAEWENGVVKPAVNSINDKFKGAYLDRITPTVDDSTFKLSTATWYVMLLIRFRRWIRAISCGVLNKRIFKNGVKIAKRK